MFRKQPTRMKDTVYILSSIQKPNGRLRASIAAQNGHTSNISSFGINTPTAPPLTGDETGDEGGETPSSEDSLHFKIIFVFQGSAARACYRSQTLSLTQPPARIHRLRPVTTTCRKARHYKLQKLLQCVQETSSGYSSCSLILMLSVVWP